eukprot:g82698.t1
MSKKSITEQRTRSSETEIESEPEASCSHLATVIWRAPHYASPLNAALQLVVDSLGLFKLQVTWPYGGRLPRTQFEYRYQPPCGGRSLQLLGLCQTSGPLPNQRALASLKVTFRLRLIISTIRLVTRGATITENLTKISLSRTYGSYGPACGENRWFPGLMQNIVEASPLASCAPPDGCNRADDDGAEESDGNSEKDKETGYTSILVLRSTSQRKKTILLNIGLLFILLTTFCRLLPFS